MTAPQPKPPPKAKQRSGGPVIPHQPRWYQWAAAWLIFAAIRVVSATLRKQWHDEFKGQPPGPVIFATWHNRLVLSMLGYFGHAHKLNATAGMAAMVSASKDGGFLAAVLECFGVQPVRGSTSRRGPQALLELTTWAERGYDLAITPDGPRGPCYVVQEGVMSLAQITGLPVVPFSYHLKWKIRAKSWDGFQIPLPFSRCELFFGKPIYVPREATDAQREALRAQLEAAMRSISRD